jgi:hypothetical protein
MLLDAGNENVIANEEMSMRHIALLGGALMGLGATVWGTSAHAQEEGNYFNQTVPAPSDALELRVGTGYTQGFGMIAPGRGIPDVAGPGIGVNAAVDYRINPSASVGVAAQYQEFANELNSAARGLNANVGLTYHLTPIMRGDPYLRVGTGYRLLWSVNPPGAPTTLLHGFELAAANIGYDVRVSEDVAIAPEVGADLNLFLWQDQNGVNSNLSSAQVGTFIFAGLQGRFDAGGTKTTTAPTMASAAHR